MRDHHGYSQLAAQAAYVVAESFRENFRVISAATVNEKMAAAIAAIESGDWESAERSLMAAAAALNALPNQGKGNANLQWDRVSITNLIRDVRAKISGQKGIQKSKIHFLSVRS